MTASKIRADFSLQIILRAILLFGFLSLSLITYVSLGCRGLIHFAIWFLLNLFFFNSLEYRIMRSFKNSFERRINRQSILFWYLNDFLLIPNIETHCECCINYQKKEADMMNEKMEQDEAEKLSLELKTALKLKSRKLFRPPSIVVSDDIFQKNSLKNIEAPVQNPTSQVIRGTSPEVVETTSRKISKSPDIPQVLQYEIGGHNRAMMRRKSSHFITEEQDMICDLLEHVSDSSKLSTSKPWRLVQYRHDVRVWVGDVQDSAWLKIRGRMRCVSTPAEILSLLIDDKRVQEYDRLIDKVTQIERIDDTTCIRWSTYKAIWPARPRDFVIKTTWEEFADGTIVIATKSVTHPKYPETPNYERGNMLLCGYVISPKDIVPGTETIPSTPAAGHFESFSTRSIASSVASLDTNEHNDDDDDDDDNSNGCHRDSLNGGAVHGSEVTLYSHSDLGGALLATITNRLCIKPAYRTLRKIQKLSATGAIALPPKEKFSMNGGTENTGVIQRTRSDEILQTLIENSTLEEGKSVNNHDRTTKTKLQLESSTSQVEKPKISTMFAAAEARRIIALLERMASEKNDWIRLGNRQQTREGGVSNDSLGDMALYKWPIPYTKRVRLGASALVRTTTVELLGLLLESAAMLGPDYIVDGQEVIESLSSMTGTSVSNYPSPLPNDTAIIWFSCTHRRQRIRRDFVVLRCFRKLTSNDADGGLMAFASIDHPGYPPTSSFIRGKIEMCGFVVLPHHFMNDTTEIENIPKKMGMGAFATAAVAAVVDAVGAVPLLGGGIKAWSPKVKRPPRITESIFSEVYFYTHLSFSDNLPALEDVQASRYLLGPLHILRELRKVVDRALEYTEVIADGQQNEEMADIEEAASGGENQSASQLSKVKSDNKSLFHSAASLKSKREEALRDLLVLASDGECMDGPQADWHLVRDGGDLGTRLWKCEQPGSAWSMIRTRARLNAKPTTVLDLLLDESRIKEYDDMFDSIKMIERVDNNAMFKRTAYKPVWPTQPRDFCLLSSWGTLDDGSAYLVNRSIDHRDCPEVKGYVRGFLVICGFLMVPTPGNPNSCTLTMVLHTELGGSLPPTIINKISTGAPAQVSMKLQKIFSSRS